LYIPVPELEEDEPSDPLMRTLKDIHWRPWTHNRFLDRTSGDYQLAVHALAEELVARVAAVERTDVVAAAIATEREAEADEAGTLDRLARLEEAMPLFTETLESLSAQIAKIGEIMESGTKAMEVGDK
jgi:hypothetical protein